MGFELVLPVEPRFMASAVAVDDWAAEGSLVLVFEHVPLELEFSFEVYEQKSAQYNSIKDVWCA